MMTINDKLVDLISELELELQSFVRFPEYIEINETAGPYTVSRIWFDELDNVPTLGVTYTEVSVKNKKKLNIFKPVRIGVAMSIIDIWREALPELIKKLLDHAPHGSTRVTTATDKILKELRTR
jgi:hypothetical protein